MIYIYPMITGASRGGRKRIRAAGHLLAGMLGFHPVFLSAGVAQQPGAAAVSFPCRELLGRPTDRSVTIHAMADTDVDIFYEFGTAPAAYTAQTEVERHLALTPFAVVLRGLAPDTRYHYRMRYRTVGATAFKAGEEHSFVTQRPRGRTFSFAVEADPHLDDNASPDLYRRTLENILGGGSDFLIDLGDTFMSEKLAVYTPDSIRLRHLLMRSFFDATCHSVPLYLVIGNHEGELGWRLDGTANSLPVLASNTRTALFPNPVDDGFYSGNTASEPFVGPRQNYYSWEWGDALFVVLDPYWYTAAKPAKDGDGWPWTLGKAQYDWFAAVLRDSKAKYRVVFSHQLIGGRSEGRGGTEFVDFFAMGGRNADGTWGFAQRRPGWELPLHQLMRQYHVNAFFHGHDHFFARQVKDGITYQLVPQPGNPNYRTANQAANYGYITGDILPCAGYLRVTVSDTSAAVEYVRSYLPADESSTRRNREVSFRYVLAPGGAAVPVESDAPRLPERPMIEGSYPHPFRDATTIRYSLPAAGPVRLSVRDVLGRTVAVVSEGNKAAGRHEAVWSVTASPQGAFPRGMYFIVLESRSARTVSRILIKE